MRIGNLGGRAVLIPRDKVAIDIAVASAGALPADPMAYCDLALHPALAQLAEDSSIAERHSEPFEEAALWSPVPRPGKIIAVGVNYVDHAAEADFEVGAEPSVFAKFSSSINGPYAPIVLPADAKAIDYEIELVAVIGQTLRHVAEHQVWDALAGLTGGQDISDRKEQLRGPLRQFVLAKSYDTFSPVGPCLATTDEFPDSQAIDFECQLDGQVVQRGTSSEMCFPISRIIAWLSERMTLEPGDLLFTGTPAGVGGSRRPPLFLRPGMTITSHFSGIGTMRNAIVATELSHPIGVSK